MRFAQPEGPFCVTRRNPNGGMRALVRALDSLSAVQEPEVRIITDERPQKREGNPRLFQ